MCFLFGLLDSNQAEYSPFIKNEKISNNYYFERDVRRTGIVPTIEVYGPSKQQLQVALPVKDESTKNNPPSSLQK